MNHSSRHLLGGLAVTMFLFASPNAQADHWVSAGKAPSSDGGGFSLSAMTQKSDTFAWGLGVVFNGELAGENVLDYSVPHNDYKNLGIKRTGNAIGLDAVWFPSGASAWKPYLGLGLYYDKQAEVARSNVTGWYYTHEEKSKLRGGVEMGMQHRMAGGSLLGLGYHSIRGAYLSLGW